MTMSSIGHLPSFGFLCRTAVNKWILVMMDLSCRRRQGLLLLLLLYCHLKVAIFALAMAFRDKSILK